MLPLKCEQANHVNSRPPIKLASLQYDNAQSTSNDNTSMPDNSDAELCREWRTVAWKPSKLNLYRKHFNSHDFSDWFLYTAIFDEAWHAARRSKPVYVDIAANHAKRWSTTWFFDRCMHWTGICIEPNDVYWSELTEQRSCQLVPRCVSDIPRSVNFSFTEAHGGVVFDGTRERASAFSGIDERIHRTDKRYSDKFRGIKEIECTTISHIFQNNKEPIQIDLMSLDVEGHEYPVLEGIDWAKIIIDVIIVENKRQEIINLLHEKKYIRYNSISKDDIWIRSGSDVKIDVMAISRLHALNVSSLKFPSHLIDDEVEYEYTI